MKLNGSSREGRHSGRGEQPSKKSKGMFGGDNAQLPQSLKEQLDRERSESVFEPEEDEEYAAPVKKRRVWVKVLLCLLVVLAGAVVAYAIWEKPPEISDTVVKNTPVVAATSAPENTAISDTTPETEEPEPEDPAPTRRDGCYTFLLCAMDQVGANTDTIIVGRMDTNDGTLGLVNIPRDTLVNVSWGVKKVNTVLVAEDNDPEKFIEKLGDILGFEIDCYAVVNIKAVEKLVDCIGGVYYDVPRDMDYDDPTQDLHVHISKGYQWLNGEDAVKVLRFRVGNEGTGYANGDLGRIATQQDFLMSIASQMLTLGNIPNLSSAIEIFQDYVTTDLTSGNLAFFIRQFLTMNKDNISFATLPGEGISIRGGSYYEIDIDGWLDIVNTRLNPYDQDIKAENLNILQYESGVGVYSTSGEIEGGANSFYDFSQYVG
jgi:LCP family protein required for cell wall assembly